MSASLKLTPSDFSFLYDREEEEAMHAMQKMDRISASMKINYPAIIVHSFTMLNEYPEYYPTSGETIMENCYYFGMELIEEIGKRFVYGDAWGPDGGSLTYNSETDRWIMKIGFYTVSIHISRTAILDESIDIPNDLMRYCVSINMVGEMDAKDCHVQDNQNVAIYNRVAKFHQCLQEEIRGASPVSEPTLRKGLDMTVAFIPAEKPPLLFGNPRRPPRVRPIKLFTKPRPRPRRMEAQLIKLFENMHI